LATTRKSCWPTPGGVLRRSRFLTGEHDAALDVRDVTWINPGGGEMTPSDWNNGWAMCFGVILDGRAVFLHNDLPLSGI
jgi:hypothetical protein